MIFLVVTHSPLVREYSKWLHDEEKSTNNVIWLCLKNITVIKPLAIGEFDMSNNEKTKRIGGRLFCQIVFFLQDRSLTGRPNIVCYSLLQKWFVAMPFSFRGQSKYNMLLQRERDYCSNRSASKNTFLEVGDGVTHL